MKIVATIQVRMGSSRLPGKVMKEVCGRPVLGHMIERVKRAQNIDEVVVATSVNPENQVIEEYCRRIDLPCFRGSEDDVLDRMLGALQSRQADVGVEIYGDCPFADPCIIQEIISFYLDNADKYDFVGNDLKTTYPPGAEVEVFSVKALADSAARIMVADIREHGTLFIRQNPDIYRLFNFEAPHEFRYPEMELELDTEEDFQVVSAIYEALYPMDPEFSIKDVITFLLNHPDIMETNKHVFRRWKELRNE